MASFPSQGNPTCPKHCLIAVKAGGNCQLEIGNNGNATYRSLNELVRDCTRLRYLYPNVPKEDAFGLRPQTGWDAPLPPTPPPAMRFSGGAGVQGAYAWGQVSAMEVGVPE